MVENAGKIIFLWDFYFRMDIRIIMADGYAHKRTPEMSALLYYDL